MSSAAPDTLKKLISELEADLKLNPDPRTHQLAALKAALSAFPETPRVRHRPILPAQPNLTHFGVIPKPASKKDRVLRIVGEVIDEGGGRGHRKEMMERLAKLGIIGPEINANPMQTLAKYLSEAPEFVSDGDGYWKRLQQKAAAE